MSKYQTKINFLIFFTSLFIVIVFTNRNITTGSILNFEPQESSFNGSQLIIYRGVDNNIYELSYVQDSWQHKALTTGSYQRAAGDLSYYLFGSQHIIYRGIDDHIHELTYSNNNWYHNILTNDNNHRAAGNPSGHVFGTQHIVYRGQDNQIHELYYDHQNGWQHAIISSGTQQAAAGDPFGYVFGTQHIVYRGLDNQIHELYYDHQNGWQHAIISSGTQQAAAGDPIGYVFGTQHIVYRGQDNQIHELYYDHQNGWQHAIISSGTQQAAAGDPFGYVFGTQHIVYRGLDDHIHELNFTENNWQHYLLTNGNEQKTSGMPLGYVFYSLPSSPLKEPLRRFASRRDFYIGSAVVAGHLSNDTTYKNVLSTEFNIVTPESSMKFDNLQPTKDNFNFAQADQIIEFAEQNNMKVRGHTLVWHLQLPTWLLNGNWTRAELMAILENHITTVVTRYRGKVFAWDVVNEAINDDGTLRQNIWLQGIGPEYISLAYRWAHAADPQAKLYYNDYGAEGLGVKSDAVYALVQGLIQDGVPIHGVGLQMHTRIHQPPDSKEVTENITRLGSLGVNVHITEMDVRIHDGPGSPEEKFMRQAVIYNEMLDVCLNQTACSAFIMWGFTDRYSWIYAQDGSSYPEEAPLIFSPDYTPKLAYEGLLARFSEGTSHNFLPLISK